MDSKKRKVFLNAFFNFMESPEGLSEADLDQALEDEGINVFELIDKMDKIKAKYSCPDVRGE